MGCGLGALAGRAPTRQRLWPPRWMSRPEVTVANAADLVMSAVVAASMDVVAGRVLRVRSALSWWRGLGPGGAREAKVQPSSAFMANEASYFGSSSGLRMPASLRNLV